ncbi:MAG: 1-deoxy-D-xylulose-5-phosphate reductoisomerase, partial [Spirochaetales bacterium]|nr:1-deoxy-D-xylulose-5-phosphate reductoisomerase [Spirochaetales bacterium]
DFPRTGLCLSGVQPGNSRIAYTGPEGILELIKDSEADIVVNGIVGASGLMPSVQTLECGIDLALANKESMVLAGPLIKHLASVNNCRLLPVDSEHSAIFKLMEKRTPGTVSEIILTASGGPFRNRELSDFPSITKADALAHPTWDMGPKITIDSATLANKGLEVIEAQQLFDFDIDKIKVLIHPQSYVHSLIRTKDLALYAQISAPDMRLPIQDALFYPAMKEVPWTFLDLAGKVLEFQEPDFRKFPMLKHAFDCAARRGAYSIAYNGANEIAVDAFLNDRISYSSIAEVTEHTLQSDWSQQNYSVEEILSSDARARTTAEEFIRNISL